MDEAVQWKVDSVGRLRVGGMQEGGRASSITPVRRNYDLLCEGNV